MHSFNMAQAGANEAQTQRSIALRPIFDKVQQLIKVKQIRKQKQKANEFIKVIQSVPNIDLKLGIDKTSQLIHKRLQHLKIMQKKQQTLPKFLNQFSKTQTKIDKNQLRVKTKSQKMLNFLRANKQRPEKKNNEPQSPTCAKQNEDHPQQFERNKFTPMRPVSRFSYGYDVSLSSSQVGTQLTKRSGTHSKSSGSYNQTVRLSHVSSNKTSPSKYLRKGHRMRQTLLKQLQVNTPQDIQEQKQLVYLKQYDQWVPASLASYKKMQLQHFLNILTGGKKNIEQKQSIVFQPIYL